MLKDLMTCIHSILLDLSSDLLPAITSHLGKKRGRQAQPLILHHNNKTHSAKKTIQGGKCENGSSFLWAEVATAEVVTKEEVGVAVAE